jgi:hypothetical protein
MPDDFAYAPAEPFFYIMLPKANYYPPACAQLGSRCLVPLNVFLQLWQPIPVGLAECSPVRGQARSTPIRQEKWATPTLLCSQ